MVQNSSVVQFKYFPIIQIIFFLAEYLRLVFSKNDHIHLLKIQNELKTLLKLRKLSKCGLVSQKIGLVVK